MRYFPVCHILNAQLYVLFELSKKYSPSTNEGALHTLRPNHNLLVVGLSPSTLSSRISLYRYLLEMKAVTENEKGGYWIPHLFQHSSSKVLECLLALKITERFSLSLHFIESHTQFL